MKLSRRVFCVQRHQSSKQFPSKPPIATPVTSTQKFEKKLKVTTKYKPVSNIQSVLHDIDHCLGVNSPPSMEYLYVVPHVAFSMRKLFWLLGKGVYSSSNPYGHSALRYTTSDGEQFVMNIVGKPGRRMVNFLQPTDYLFGDPAITCDLGSEQGGVFHRDIIGFRLEGFAPHKIDAMHEYFVKLQQREIEKRDVKFNLMALPGWIRVPLLTKAYERGNCAFFTSKGLVAADIFKQPTIFPKYIFAKLYMKAINSYGWHGMRSKVNIVSYNQVIVDEEEEEETQREHRKQKDTVTPHGWTTPLLFSSANRNFRNLKKFADCNVNLETDVLENGDICYKANIQKCEPWKPKFLNIWDE